MGAKAVLCKLENTITPPFGKVLSQVSFFPAGAAAQNLVLEAASLQPLCPLVIPLGIGGSSWGKGLQLSFLGCSCCSTCAQQAASFVQ
jgi:hypothetical protein